MTLNANPTPVHGTPSLTLDTIAVRNINGLFCLNDLHAAAGGELRHRPVEFLRLEQTQALVNELQKGGDSHLFMKVVKGRSGGTYACRELVIAYAAWISAAFHLKVIRVFLENTRPYNPAIDYIRISPEQAQRLQELVQKVVDSGAQKHGETWARFHRKFKVNSYLQLPASQFDEACQYLANKLPPKQSTQTAAPPLPAQIEAANEAANAIAAKVQAEVFKAALSGGESWKYQRWMAAFVSDSQLATPAVVVPVPNDAVVMNVPKFIKAITTHDIPTSTETLIHIAQASMAEVQRRMTGQASLQLAA